MSDMLQIDVCGLGGFKCKFSIRDPSTVAEIKETIQKITQMQVDEQQLIRGTEQLEDATALVSCSERNLSLTLLRRSPEETEWIGRLRCGWGLKAVPAHLRTHRSIALAALHRFSHAVGYLPVELKHDPEVLIIANRSKARELQESASRKSQSSWQRLIRSLLECQEHELAFSEAAPEGWAKQRWFGWPCWIHISSGCWKYSPPSEQLLTWLSANVPQGWRILPSFSGMPHWVHNSSGWWQRTPPTTEACLQYA